MRLLSTLGLAITLAGATAIAQSATTTIPATGGDITITAIQHASVQVEHAGKDRYVIEVQGFTDKTGSAEANTVLSQKRAENVARYLINEHKIPVHMVTMMGSGYTQPVADDKTRDGRKQNRRVEVRLFVPEISSAAQTLSAQK